MTTDLATLPTWSPADEPRLWRKLVRVAAKIAFADQLVAAWYCAKDPATPMHVRAVLLGALGYFLLPADAIPDVIAGIGFTDDASVIAAVVTTFARHITQEHREAARRRLDQLLR
ncbi:YkvA family protein [Benzoatithermus flavus]|uniref:YkvA family protein n=1 Tax=Benzoatithermus flavus TaxID=3108223 RepID=A0ABU8XUS0_9PROT